MKTKLFGILLFAVLALTCAFILPTEAKAASESDLTFELNEDGNSYCVSGCDSSTEGELTIPATHNGKPITKIGDSAFYHYYYLASVTIPDSVTNIGYAAFYECPRLTSVTIPASVTTIGDLAFCGGANRTGIWVDKNNPNYCSDNNGVLFNKNKTTLVVAPCTIKSYTIPDSVTSIGEYAFSNCDGLKSVTIPAGVTSIGNGAFSGCRDLTSVTIPTGATTIGEGTFRNCATLTSVTIPDSVTEIGEYAFSSTGLTFVTIPDSVTEIGKSAFGNCDGLTSVTIPDSVAEISESTFSYCGSLTSVTIPDSVTKIGESAFYCTALSSVIIPDSVTTIGDKAFYATRLRKITIPASVTEIGKSAFGNCTGLNTVYYAYDETQFTKMSIGAENDPLLNAEIIYNFAPLATEPAPIPTVTLCTEPTAAPFTEPTQVADETGASRKDDKQNKDNEDESGINMIVVIAAIVATAVVTAIVSVVIWLKRKK